MITKAFTFPHFALPVGRCYKQSPFATPSHCHAFIKNLNMTKTQVSGPLGSELKAHLLIKEDPINITKVKEV